MLFPRHDMAKPTFLGGESRISRQGARGGVELVKRVHRVRQNTVTAHRDGLELLIPYNKAPGGGDVKVRRTRLS